MLTENIRNEILYSHNIKPEDVYYESIEGENKNGMMVDIITMLSALAFVAAILSPYRYLKRKKGSDEKGFENLTEKAAELLVKHYDKNIIICTDHTECFMHEVIHITHNKLILLNILKFIIFISGIVSLIFLFKQQLHWTLIFVGITCLLQILKSMIDEIITYKKTKKCMNKIDSEYECASYSFTDYFKLQYSKMIINHMLGTLVLYGFVWLI
jgi:NADH:ubiquinone oxidoreductase subunit 3 (subunit A)